MKRLIATALLFACLPLAAKKSRGLLDGYEDYFVGAHRDKGMLSVKATDDFEALSSGKQEAEIKDLMLDLDERLDDMQGPILLRVDQGPAGSLWALPEGGRAPYKFESWDKTRDLSLADNPAGHWFTYVGVGAVLGLPSTLDSMNFGINYGVRVGSFLLNDLFDLGVSVGGNYNLGFSEYSFDTSNSYNLGLFGRVHFPIIGPLGGSVGGEGSLTSSGSSSYPNSGGKGTESSSNGHDSALLAGVSFFFPAGSLDFDARFSTTTTYNIGITTLLGGPRVSQAADEDEPAATKPRARRKSPTHSPTPLATHAQSPETTPTLMAKTPEPEPTATRVPTQEPTPANTSSPVPTLKPTAEATPDRKAEEAAKKLEAERKDLDEEKAKLAQERKKLEEDTKAAAEEAENVKSGASAGILKRSGFSLYAGNWNTKIGSKGLNVDGIQLDLGLTLFFGDFRVGGDILTMHGQYGSATNTGGPGGNQSEPQFDLSAFGGILGYDWTVIRAKSAQGIDLYFPVSLGVHQVELNAGGDYSGGSVDAALGLGIRWRMASAFALDLSGRYHVSLMKENMSNGQSSNNSGNTLSVDSNLEGAEVSLATDFYLW